MGKALGEPTPSERVLSESTRAARRGLELAAAADALIAEWQRCAGGAAVIWEDNQGVLVRRRNGSPSTSDSSVWHEHPIASDDGTYGVVRANGPLVHRSDSPVVAALSARTAVLALELRLWADTEAQRRGEKVRRLLDDSFTEEVATLFELCGLPRDTGPLRIVAVELAGGPPFQEMDRLRAFLVPRFWSYKPTFPFVGYAPNGLVALIPIAACKDLPLRLRSWLDAWSRMQPQSPARAVLVSANGLATARDALYRAYATLSTGAWLGRFGLLPDSLDGAVGQVFAAMGRDRLVEFVRWTLKDLVMTEHDELLKTLWVYLEADHALHQAAERLHVHRNTLLYRLHQIERLTGRSLHHTPDVTMLWMALQGWAWLKTIGSSGRVLVP